MSVDSEEVGVVHTRLGLVVLNSAGSVFWGLLHGNLLKDSCQQKEI